MLDRKYIEQKRNEYREAYQSALATANANHGAMQAMDDLLIEMDKEKNQTPSAPENEAGTQGGA